INLPPMVTALVFANLAVHGARQFLPPRPGDWLILHLGFLPAVYGMADWPLWSKLAGPLAHQFLHDGWLHLGVNIGFLMAFGSGMERRLGPWRLLGFYLICGVLAAVGHYIVYPGSTAALIGASGAISGLFGGLVRLMHRRGAAANHRLWLLVALWVGISLVFGATGVPGAGGDIAWAAHVGGFLAGLVLVGRFDPRRPDAGVIS
ncbi:MAG: rhomboid family intramembrane serine protease, partial [Dongiaceae bacterium]